MGLLAENCGACWPRGWGIFGRACCACFWGTTAAATCAELSPGCFFVPEPVVAFLPAEVSTSTAPPGVGWKLEAPEV
jgi:hypothetical protein